MSISESLTEYQRLDKNTSGLVLFAKTYGALQEYNTLMRERKLGKFYNCVVEGRVTKAGEVKGYLLKDHDRNRVTISKNETADSQFVDTLFSPIEIFGNYTLLEVELKTGRSHQIRASLSSICYPLVGDMKYGAPKRIMKGKLIFLHARELEFEHPVKKTPVRFTAKLPDHDVWRNFTEMAASI